MIYRTIAIEVVNKVSMKKVLCITKNNGQHDKIKLAKSPACIEYNFFTI